jgi:hypothetical protein
MNYQAKGMYELTVYQLNGHKPWLLTNETTTHLFLQMPPHLSVDTVSAPIMLELET